MTARQIIHRTILTIAILVVLIGGAMLAAAIWRGTLGSRALAKQAATVVTQTFLDPGTTRVRVGDLTGNPLSGVALHNVRLEVRAESGEQAWVPVFAARKIAVTYAPGDLVRGRLHFSTIHFDQPVVRFPAAGTRRPQTREPRAPRAPASEPRGPITLEIDALHVTGGRVIADSATAPRLGNLSVAGLGFDLHGRLSVAGGTVHADLDSLIVAPRGQAPLIVTGPVELADRRLTLSGLTLAQGASRIWIEGEMETDSRRGALVAELDPLDLSDARALLGADWLDRPGWVRGKVRGEGELADLGFEADLMAVAGPDTVQRFAIHGRLEPDALEIGELLLTFDEVTYHGTGWVGFGERSGSSHGRVTFEDVDLHRLPGLRGRAGLPPGRLSGTLAVLSEHRSAAGPVRPFELDITRGQVAGVAIAEGKIVGSLGRRGELELTQYTFSTRGAEVSGEGRLDPDEITMTQTVAITDLEALAGMFGEERCAGRGEITAEIAGPLAAPEFTVDGAFDSLRVGPLALEHAAVSIVDGVLAPDLAFSARVTAAGGRVAQVPVDSLALAASYGGGQARIEEFAAARGDARLKAAGAVTFAPEFLGIDLSDLQLEVGESRLANRGPVKAERRGRRWTFAQCEIAGPGGQVELAGRVDPGVDTDFSLHAGDVDLAALEWLHRIPGLAGRIELRCQAKDFGRGLQLETELAADSVNVRGFTAERVTLSAALAGDTLEISKATLVRGGTIEVSGKLTLPPDTSGTGLKRFAAREALRTSSVELALAAPALDLVAWHGLNSQLDQVTGKIGLTLAITGSPLAPDGLLTLKAEELAIAGEPIGPLDLLAELEGGQLVIARGEVHPSGGPIVVIGPTPVQVSLVAAPTLDRTAPLDLTVELPGASLGIARYLHDRVADAEGEVLGRVDVRGTLDEPQLAGAVTIASGTIQVRGRDEVLERVEGHVVFEGQVIRLVEVTATDGKKGRFHATGEVILQGPKVRGYDLAVELQEFAVGVPGEYQGTIDGTFTLRKNMAGSGPLAEYAGTVKVLRLDYLREIVGRSRPSEPGPSSWVGTFQIDLPRNVWIRNTDLEVELKGRVTYERTLTGSVMLGEVETVRGRYDLFGHTFRITDGEIQFTDPERVDPVVNVSAETRIPEARIFANISGRASDRQVTLTSDPDYDQSTILKFLVPTGTSEVTSLLALTPVVQELERALSHQIPGLSLQMESRTVAGADQSTLGARVGTYVVPELFISAYQGFSSSTEQDVSVEYGLSGIVFVKGSVVRRGVTAGTTGKDVLEEYNVDLNLRWEF